MHNERKLESVLLGILHILGKGSYRAQLVKMVYFIDEANSRLCGETVTGLTYIWDFYGPNAESDEIVKTLDVLKDTDVLDSMARRYPNAEGHYYELSESIDPSKLDLTADEWAGIQSVVREYGKLNSTAIARVSKQTKPFEQAEQHDTLCLQRDPALQITEKEIANDPLLREALSAIASDAGERVSLDELRVQLA